MDSASRFQAERREQIDGQSKDREFRQISNDWLKASIEYKYSYHYEWLGRPIIQFPQDILAIQEIIWEVKPDLIIETGIAHGGSLILSASVLELNSSCGGPSDAEVIGIDIDIRRHNRTAIEKHPLSRRISMIEGSSVEIEVVDEVRTRARESEKVMVFLDSHHTAQHVSAELDVYAPLVTVGSYCVVFDTLIEFLPPNTYSDRPWSPGDNPMTAVSAFLSDHSEFIVDNLIDNKLMLSNSPGGYLRRVRV